MQNYPYSSHSWTLVSASIAIKEVDKSLIKEKKTGVPKDIAHFFEQTKKMASGDKLPITCIFNGKAVEAKLECVAGRFRIDSIPTPKGLSLDDQLVFEKKGDEIHIEFLTERRELQEATTETEKSVKVRLKQAKFRRNVIEVCQSTCIVTGVNYEPVLIASHIKSWKDSDDKERVDGHNGLLLAPHIDNLFDKHLISFSPAGTILIAPRVPKSLFKSWHIDLTQTYSFTEQQRNYLKVHRAIFNELHDEQD